MQGIIFVVVEVSIVVTSSSLTTALHSASVSELRVLRPV